MGLVERVKSTVAGLFDPAIPELPLWQQFQRIGGAVGPQVVSQILREADGGQIGRYVDLTHEARQKDGHLHAVLQTRELAIQGLEWDVTPPIEEPSEDEKKAAALFKRALRNCESFPLALGHLTGESLLFAFAYCDVIWKVETEDPELRGMMVPAEFIPVSCRRFGYTAGEGKLLFNPNGIWATVDSGGIDLDEEYPPGKFLVDKDRRINGDVPAREGLGRVLLWAAIFRNWDVGDWLKLGEGAWKPHKVGKYKKGSSPADIEALKTALRTLESSQRTVLPETVDLAMEWPKNAVSGLQSMHKELAEFLGMEMSKATIGGTLTVESGSKGARSLGDVHNEVRKDIRESDGIGRAATVRRCLARPFYELNYGSRFQVGEFFFLTEDPVDLKAFSEAIERLRKAGLRIPASYVRDRAGMPEPKEGEEMLETAEGGKGNGDGTGPNKDGSGKDDSDDGAGDEGDDGDE